MSRFVLAIVKITGFPIALIFFKRKTYYVNKKSQNRRIKGSAIIVSNHTSLMDFALYMFTFLTRSLRFLMAEVLFNKGRLFARFLYWIGGIRVDRESFDFSFVGKTSEILDKGGVVGIFPEGKLPINGQMSPFRPSTVMVALSSNAPIIPVYTDGNYGLFKRARVMIGEKFYLQDYCSNNNPSKEEIARLNDIIKCKILELKVILESRGK